MRHLNQVIASENEYASAKSISARKRIDEALVGVLVLIIIAAVSLVGTTTLAIDHIAPFNNCVQCEVHK